MIASLILMMAPGIFALQAGSATTRAYMTDSVRGSSHTIDLWFTRPNSDTAIRSFDVDMTKRLHMIVVSDDFRTFLHIHPALDARGHFHITQRLQPHVRYNIYADATPHSLGKQVFRFTAGDGVRARSRDSSRLRKSTTADAYTVTLSSAVLNAGSPMLTVSIKKSGRPATDLLPYLGAAAHAVFINAADLSYAHAHPVSGGESMPGMDMSASGMDGPDMRFHAGLRKSGMYKLWVQFRSTTGLHVAAFAVRVLAKPR